MQKLKWLILFVASLLYVAPMSRAAVVRSVELGTSTARRPLADFPLWWVGFWALDEPAAWSAPSFRSLYAACCLELSMRRQEQAARAAVTQFTNGLMRRWRVTVATRMTDPMEVINLRWFTMPRGTVIRNHVMKEYGRRHEIVLDVPVGEEVTPLSPRVTAHVIDMGLANASAPDPSAAPEKPQ